MLMLKALVLKKLMFKNKKQYITIIYYKWKLGLFSRDDVLFSKIVNGQPFFHSIINVLKGPE